MSDQIVSYEERDGIALITMDDGKANALSPAMITQLQAAFDRAEGSARAIVLTGRPGRFSAGFDLRIMMAGPAQARDLLIAGSEMFMRIYESPKPVVIAATGHAIAGGALLMATGDTRFGIVGDFKIGLNEVANSMPVPILAHRLAKDRLDPRAFVESVLHAKMYDAEGAVVAGWLDHAVHPDALLDQALAEAARLGELPAFAYGATKESIRRESIAHIRDTLADDLQHLSGG